ncbi:hypothetical protein [Reinekea marinisedimentorum]|uniref:Uncharacterized protein n=1 Tax=Reinekea marinisedimentorum TaxID=230495 RepID=A0A4V6NY11_9GAMM|nr:hypothetical protein [Reinekea marinisedimentorum]TCS38870.1 hypothetical protein BCF53_11435 [Reinekea marinisedimentorum]
MTVSDQNSRSVFGRLATISHEDESLNAETWFTVQPCRIVKLFGKPVVITQPSSSFWVYLLGILTTAVGVYFLARQGEALSRLYWGWSLILWGVGALIAGTSYQAFGYQLKCAGREKVAWTSWWEVIYLIFQQYSINVMLVAVVYSCLPSAVNIAVAVAILVSVVYAVVVLYGAFKPVKELITYELMVKFCTPFIYFFILLNGWRLVQYGLPLDAALLGVWFGLIITDRLYWWYYNAGLTGKLWAKGRWFSENDVLHVALVVWVIYIAVVLVPLVEDAAV